MKSKIALALLLVLGLAAFAPPNEVIFDEHGNKLPDSDVNSEHVNWKLMSIKDGKRFSGFGLVDIFGGGGCSGTFLDTGAGPDGPAYILSNGHCAGPNLMGPRDVLVDKAPAPGMNFRFNYFVDAAEAQKRVPIKRIAYATMHGTDVTVFELDATFGQLVRAGFTPYAIAKSEPRRGEPVEMVGIPQNSIKRATRFLRRSTCQLTGRANLMEGGYEFRGAFIHSCSSVGGSSGTSMVSLESHEIVAINNTGVNDNAVREKECAINRPCEVAADGSISTNFNVNYAQRVTDITTCFDANGAFSMSVPGCRLER